MAVTKKDLADLHKSIIAEISKFLEKHVIEKLFKLEKDVGGLKKDVGGLKEDMAKIKHDVEQIDHKLDKSIERVDRHGETLENHEKRIGHLETAKFT